MCMGETKQRPSRTPLRRTICSTSSVMCTISRRLRVSKTMYSVWLFMGVSSPLILKIAVNPPDLRNAEAHVQQGLDLLTAGAAADAAEAFRAAIAADATHVEAHHGLIRALRDAGRAEDAIAAALA